jgi:hypothetical protein
VGVDPFSFVGAPEVAWKMAFCERELAIHVGLLAVGVASARWRHLPPLGFAARAVAIAPMAVDSFTQLFGRRRERLGAACRDWAPFRAGQRLVGAAAPGSGIRRSDPSSALDYLRHSGPSNTR